MQSRTWHADGTYYAKNREKLLAASKERARKQREGIAEEPAVCCDCGAHFERKRGPLSARCPTCRSEYRAAAQSLAQKKKRMSNAAVRRCAICSGPSVAPKYCSDACSDVGIFGAPRPCKICGSVFQPKSRGSECCSPGCRYLAITKPDDHRATVARENRRRWGMARRAMKRAATVERVDPIKVCESAKWRCQQCGIDTPQSLRGTTNQRAPECDHIVPLSRGGEHSYANSQCLCRRCNNRKSNFLPSELGLNYGPQRAEGDIAGGAIRPR